MLSSDFREEARKRLTGKWGKVAIMVLAYMALFFVIGFIEGILPEPIQPILSLAELIIEIPLGFGLIYALVKVYNGEDVSAFDFVSLGFNNFKKSWGVSLNVALKMLLPIILIIVSYFLIFGALIFAASSAILSPSSATSAASTGGIVSIIGFILLIVSMIWAITKSFYYQLAMLIAMENPDMSSKDAVLKSQELMTGNRGKLFCLQFSFIGWSILATITFGIGFLWLLPYIQFATIAFYKHLNGDSSNNEVVSNVEINDNNENL